MRCKKDKFDNKIISLLYILQNARFKNFISIVTESSFNGTPAKTLICHLLEAGWQK